MIQKLKLIYNDKRTWFYLVTTAAWGGILAIIVLLINTKAVPIINQVPDFLLTNVSLAESILSTLAGALLTITTFTFSTTMVVLTTYSSNYSPRVVENFLQDRRTMKVLGTFIGGFLYSITTLFFLGEIFTSDRVLSASVAILYALWCVIQFVIFIFAVANSVQAQNLISSLYHEAKDIVETFIDENKSRRRDSYKTDYFANQDEIFADESGYLVVLDSNEIHNNLSGREYRLVIHPQIGDFISKGDPLALLLSHENDKELADTSKKIRKSFNFSSKRYTITDYRYAIQKLVDIALRAISPGINDPNTAISCIHSLELLTGRLGTIEGDYQIIEAPNVDEGTFADLILENYNFRNDLYDTYSQLIHYGKKDISVVVALLDAMAGAIITSSPGNQTHLREMAQYIYESCRNNFDHPMDRAQIEKRMRKIFAIS